MSLNRTVIAKMISHPNITYTKGLFLSPFPRIVENTVLKCLYTSWQAEHGYRMNRKGLVVGSGEEDGVLQGLRLAEEYIPNFHHMVVGKDVDVEQSVLEWASTRTHWTGTTKLNSALDVVCAMASQRRALGVYVPVAEDRKNWRTLWILSDCSLPVGLFLVGSSRKVKDMVT